MEIRLPDNDNNTLLDPKVQEEALRLLSQHLQTLHRTIDQAADIIERLKEDATQKRDPDETGPR